MECADKNFPRLLGARQAGHPVLHFLGRLVSKGDRQDAEGRDLHILHEAEDAVGDDAGLARTRPGQNQGRTGVVDDRLTLFFV